MTDTVYTGPLGAVLNVLRHPRHIKELMREVRNLRFEIDKATGQIRIPRIGVDWFGEFESWIRHPNGVLVPCGKHHNLATTEGLNHMLETEFGAGSQVTTWYMAISSGAVDPADTWTAANYASNATEITAGYSQATRPEWVEGTAASKSLPTSTQATFTATGGAMTVNGHAIISNSTKGGTSGTLAAAERRSAAATVPDGSDYLAGYTITLANA